MTPKPIMEISDGDWFEPAMLFGKFVLYTNNRIDRSTVPAGLYVYELRHKDSDWCWPIEILPTVCCNYMGSIVSNEKFPINFSKYYVNIDYDAGDFDLMENMDDDELFDEWDKIPGKIDEYLNYEDMTHWSVPETVLELREEETDDI